MDFALTPAAQRAWQAAREWARRLGAEQVQSCHLLYGLLDEEEGRAAMLLARAGLDLHAVKPARTEVLGDALPPWGDTVRQLLDKAADQTSSHSADRTVSSEHLLAALLQTDEALRRSLEALGLSWPRLESEWAAAQEPPLRLDEPLQLTEPTERMDAARILDAAGNRAREALRVVEDYCRFVLDDAFLSGELKRLRHDLADAFVGLTSAPLLEARDTLRDVGTELSTKRERERHSLLEVVRANLKRLQEALRSLEEFGKLHGGTLGERLEQLRYHSYTLERAILLGTDSRRRLADVKLYVLLTGAQCQAALDWTIREAAAGGAGMFQLREKKLTDRELLDRARQVRRWTREAGVLFIMNDRPDIARLVEADGVHVGQDELPLREVRRIVGPGALIGVSTHNLDQLRQAIRDGASYVGIGPTFSSGTKAFADLAGLDFVRQATAETSLPAFVIGGVNLDTIGAAVTAGAQRVAVSQVIGQANEPRPIAAELVRLLNSPQRHKEHQEKARAENTDDPI